MSIGLFSTRVTGTLSSEAGRAIVALFDRLGYAVDFPDVRACCCGRADSGTGRREALRTVRTYLDAFSHHEVVVTPSASCAGLVRRHLPVLAERYGDARLRDQVAEFTARVHEMSELLVDILKIVDAGAYFPHRVTYHPARRSRSPRVSSSEERSLCLLRAVRGIDLVECAQAAGVEVVGPGDDLCLIHVGDGRSPRRTDVRPVHLAEILASTGKDPQFL
ncbi:MAG: heterodisulfide reductase-related iron-sulfur binding cluster [Catenulispora sp.]